MLDKKDPTEEQALQTIMDQLALNGDNEALIHNLFSLDYNEPPVSLNTFMDSDEYLGRSLKDLHGKSIVFPYWRKALRQIDISSKFEVALTGSIGCGKTTVAAIYICWFLYKLINIKNPYTFFGSRAKTKPFVIMFFSVTKSLAESEAFGQVNNMILNSPWFMRYCKESTSTPPKAILPHHIDFALASPFKRRFGVVGRDIIAGIMDEISEVSHIDRTDVSTLHSRAFKVYLEVVSRIKSRFMTKGGAVPGKLFLISSKQEKDAFLESYIEERAKDKKSNMLVFDEPLWNILPKSRYSGKRFMVALGDKTQQPVIISKKNNKENYDKQGYTIMYPPIEYLDRAKLDMDSFLRQIAGVSRDYIRKHKLFPERNSVCTVVDLRRANPFGTRTVYLKGKETLTDYFEPSALLEDTFEKEHSAHVDIGLVNDALGLSVGHVGPAKIVERTNNDGSKQKVTLPTITIDIALAVKAPKGERVRLEAIREFFLYLRDVMKINLKKITYDGFQSEDSIQLLKSYGFDSERMSLDGPKQDKKYLLLKTYVLEQRISFPDYPLLTKELEMLEHNRLKNKVDHPKNASKDVADAVCGVVNNIADPKTSSLVMNPAADMSIAVLKNAKGMQGSSMRELLRFVHDNQNESIQRL